VLKEFADYITYTLLKLAPTSHLGDALNFFIYDTLKIFLLLTTIVYAVAIIRAYFPPEKTKRILSHKREYIGNTMAALLGIVTPFCSCSAVPLFIGFVEAGVPLGVTFSFLISSPMVNEIALIMLWGLFLSTPAPGSCSRSCPASSSASSRWRSMSRITYGKLRPGIA